MDEPFSAIAITATQCHRNARPQHVRESPEDAMRNEKIETDRELLEALAKKPWTAGPLRLVLTQPLRRLLGVVGQDHVRTRALEACEGLEGHLLLVEPAFLGGCLEHGVLAGDMVRCDGKSA